MASFTSTGSWRELGGWIIGTHRGTIVCIPTVSTSCVLDAFKDHLRTEHVKQFLTRAAAYSSSVGARRSSHAFVPGAKRAAAPTPFLPRF